MKLKLLLLFCLFSFIQLNCKNIVVLSCKGGGAHSSAASAILGYLQDQHKVKVVNSFDEVLCSLDFVQRFTFGKYTGDDFYNYLINRQHVKCINFICGFAKCYINFWPVKRSLDRAFYEYFKQNKTDLIISVIPLFNNIIAGVAKKLNIPFLVVPVDLDSTHYFLSKENLDYPKFYFGVPFKKKCYSKLCFNYIRLESIVFTGFPLRGSFLKPRSKDPKNISLIKKSFNIPENKKVIMILMGGAGSTACCNYAKAIAKSKNCNLHVIMCLGRDEKSLKKISKIKFPKNISISLLGFTQQIADLMNISDLLITAPGPTSIMEALYCNTPVVLDVTRGILNLHKFNIEFIKDNNLGISIDNYNKLPLIISRLCNENYYCKFKDNMRKLNKTNPKINIQNLVNYITK